MERKRLIKILKELALTSNITEEDKAEILEMLNELQIKGNS